MFRKLILFVALSVFSGACTHALHLYHSGDFEPIPRKAKVSKVSAQAEQFTIMGFTSETNYVNTAFKELQQKCPQGKITGINTRYSTSHGFFSWTNTINMTGLCVR